MRRLVQMGAYSCVRVARVWAVREAPDIWWISERLTPMSRSRWSSSRLRSAMARRRAERRMSAVKMFIFVVPGWWVGGLKPRERASIEARVNAV